jgi:hypothetical protein
MASVRAWIVVVRPPASKSAHSSSSVASESLCRDPLGLPLPLGVAGLAGLELPGLALGRLFLNCYFSPSTRGRSLRWRVATSAW